MESSSFSSLPKKYQPDESEQKTLDAFEKLTISQDDYYQLITHTEDWEMIKKSFQSISQKETLILDQVLELIEQFIKLYEPAQDMNIGTLKTFFKKQTQEEKLEWEKKIFPQMFSLILKTPELFPDKIPLLVQGKAQKVTLTKQQCACLMSHMFMCTTISQQQYQKKLPASFNFAELYSSSFFSNDHIKLEKLKCLASYFKRISTDYSLNHKITFERLVFNETYSIDQWKNSQQKLLNLEMRPTGKIEDAAQEAIEVDFANKYLGGGAIKKGTAQEEIMFITSAETLIGVLFSEVMLDSEAILIQGTEIYCQYKGYLSNFTYDGDFQDPRPVRKDGVLDRAIVAIDALNFRRYPDINQFSEGPILRELNKAFIGFSGKSQDKKKIATGKWGCGDFHGNVQLKFMIQWLASSMAGRHMLFYSFQDVKDLKHAEEIVELYKGKEIGTLISLILSWCEQMPKNKADLFNFFINCKLTKL